MILYILIFRFLDFYRGAGHVSTNGVEEKYVMDINGKARRKENTRKT
jgi:hypothetical protein